MPSPSRRRNRPRKLTRLHEVLACIESELEIARDLFVRAPTADVTAMQLVHRFQVLRDRVRQIASRR